MGAHLRQTIRHRACPFGQPCCRPLYRNPPWQGGCQYSASVSQLRYAGKRWWPGAALLLWLCRSACSSLHGMSARFAQPDGSRSIRLVRRTARTLCILLSHRKWHSIALLYGSMPAASPGFSFMPSSRALALWMNGAPSHRARLPRRPTLQHTGPPLTVFSASYMSMRLLCGVCVRGHPTERDRAVCFTAERGRSSAKQPGTASSKGEGAYKERRNARM